MKGKLNVEFFPYLPVFRIMSGLSSLQKGPILLFKYHYELMDSDRFDVFQSTVVSVYTDTVWSAEFVLSLASRHLKLASMFFSHDSSHP